MHIYDRPITAALYNRVSRSIAISNHGSVDTANKRYDYEPRYPYGHWPASDLLA